MPWRYSHNMYLIDCCCCENLQENYKVAKCLCLFLTNKGCIMWHLLGLGFIEWISLCDVGPMVCASDHHDT